MHYPLHDGLHGNRLYLLGKDDSLPAPRALGQINPSSNINHNKVYGYPELELARRGIRVAWVVIAHVDKGLYSLFMHETHYVMQSLTRLRPEILLRGIHQVKRLYLL